MTSVLRGYIIIGITDEVYIMYASTGKLYFGSVTAIAVFIVFLLRPVAFVFLSMMYFLIYMKSI